MTLYFSEAKNLGERKAYEKQSQSCYFDIIHMTNENAACLLCAGVSTYAETRLWSVKVSSLATRSVLLASAASVTLAFSGQRPWAQRWLQFLVQSVSRKMPTPLDAAIMWLLTTRRLSKSMLLLSAISSALCLAKTLAGTPSFPWWHLTPLLFGWLTRRTAKKHCTFSSRYAPNHSRWFHNWRTNDHRWNARVCCGERYQTVAQQVSHERMPSSSPVHARWQSEDIALFSKTKPKGYLLYICIFQFIFLDIKYNK